MGTFTVPVQVSDVAGRRSQAVQAPVDTGASDTVIPREILEGLGIQPLWKEPYRLADDRVVEYDVGEARLRLDSRERTVPVVFGEHGGPTLLGATTLEIFKLGVDPIARRLVPVSGLLMIFPNDRTQGQPMRLVILRSDGECSQALDRCQAPLALCLCA